MSLKQKIKTIFLLVTNPKCIIYSIYDTPSENLMHKDIVKMYDDGIIKELLIEDILKNMGMKYKKQKIKITKVYNSIVGSISAYELQVIAFLCRILNPKKILEIGTLEGRTTINIALNTKKESKIYTLNLPQIKCPNFKVGKFFLNDPKMKKINLFFSDSKKFDFQRLPKMDFIFIDGDHTYNGVKSDTKNAFKIIKNSGVILWHDFNRCHLGSTKAIVEECNKNNFSYYKISGTEIAIGFRKRN